MYFFVQIVSPKFGGHTGDDASGSLTIIYKKKITYVIILDVKHCNVKTLLINDELYTLIITMTFRKPDGAKVKFSCEQRRYVSF